MKLNINILFKLIKIGIVVFVVLTSSCGFFLGLKSPQDFSWLHYFVFVVGTVLISAGSLALNEVQEWPLDSKMNRTSERPIPKGILTPQQALIISLSFIILGLLVLNANSFLSAVVGLSIIVLYNGFYTMIWKKKYAFAAIPGALPGALPFVMGYASSRSEILTRECLLGFLVMFFWQMPHFWVLAIKYLEDYKKGEIPVLPAVKGIEYTLEQIKIYMILYLVVSFVWFMQTPHPMVASILIVPMSLKMLIEFFNYSRTPTKWLSFFMWTNVSVLIFLCFPVISKWYGF